MPKEPKNYHVPNLDRALVILELLSKHPAGLNRNEIASASGVGMMLDEAAIPLPPAVQGASELMGLDPLYLANEGKLLALCHPDDVDTLLAAMRAHPLGAQACCIGTVTEDPHHFVQMRTAFGGCRMLDWLMGDPLPRIC